MIVVSDTSPIRALAQLDLLHVLQALFEEVLVPPAVVAELSVEVAGLPRVDASRIAGLRIEPPSDQSAVATLLRCFGPGESEAIARAIERGAGLLLVDDGRARRAAERRGLTAIGVLAVLVRCKAAGLVPRVAPLIDRLRREIDFRVSERTRTTTLRLAGESE